MGLDSPGAVQHAARGPHAGLRLISSATHSGFGYAMDEKGGKVGLNSVESLTGIPATDVYLLHGSKSQLLI